jgi:indole-3-glycerol phosphate synthase
MHPRLENILAEKVRETARLKREGRFPAKQRTSEIRDFEGALRNGDGVGVIAEIKFRSPSAGKLHQRTDPASIARTYAAAGAAAISCLTDSRFFGGDVSFLPALKAAVQLPVLRKDFLIDPVQVEESRRYGADAVLLICRILSASQLREMAACAADCGLGVLAEVHTLREMETAAACGARVLGINNRDLESFAVDLETTRRLASGAPAGAVVVSESGIRDAKDVCRVASWGARSVLVGTSLMTHDHPKEKLQELVEAGASRTR